MLKLSFSPHDTTPHHTIQQNDANKISCSQHHTTQHISKMMLKNYPSHRTAQHHTTQFSKMMLRTILLTRPHHTTHTTQHIRKMMLKPNGTCVAGVTDSSGSKSSAYVLLSSLVDRASDIYWLGIAQIGAAGGKVLFNCRETRIEYQTAKPAKWMVRRTSAIFWCKIKNVNFNPLPLCPQISRVSFVFGHWSFERLQRFCVQPLVHFFGRFFPKIASSLDLPPSRDDSMRAHRTIRATVVPARVHHSVHSVWNVLSRQFHSQSLIQLDTPSGECERRSSTDYY